MRAALMHSPGDSALDLRDDVTTVGPDPGEVKIRVRATGVCHSDVSALKGILPASIPAVLGHEAAGEVVAVGDLVTSVQPGDHVVLSFVAPCGTCADCLGGQPYLCLPYTIEAFTKPRFRLGDGSPCFALAGLGAWAEELVVPAAATVKIDNDVPFELAALLSCAVATGVGAVINTARVEEGASAVVIGAGGIGLSVIQGLRLAGAATILAVDPVEAKHATAKRFGATHTATPDDLDMVKGLLTAGRGFDYAFEAVGRSATIKTAWGATRRGGNVVVVGAGAADDMFQVDAFSLLFEGKSILSSVYGSSDLRRDVNRFVSLWRAGRLDLESLVTRRIRFEDLNDAVLSLDKGGDMIRQVVLFD
ncbi:alcohol dehydrogenase catalytic domain-containing protein [Streptosporangium sp. NPDC000396]|uniref:alcohol dehydrogenase catalytic domain-containing protein n=1 Tax=Streptosporangium sp. NPDC000396 TaxID=3366185 RepID=UPI0036819C95